MEEQFITLLIKGSIKDPILWILSFIFGSGLLIKNLKSIYFYLFIGGIFWGLIRLYIYKALGEVFSINQTSQLIFICLLFMLFFGISFFFIIILFKTKE